MKNRFIQKSAADTVALRILIALFSLFALLSCKEDPPVSAAGNDVVFYAQLQINGQSRTLNAGEDNYYMHTAYSRDSLNIFSFHGVLSDFDCYNPANTCPNTLEITFRDDTAFTDEQSNIDNSLKEGELAYRAPTDSTLIGYEVEFSSNVTSPGGNYSLLWDFGDGNQSTQANPSHTYAAADNNVNICLYTEDTDSNVVSSNCLMLDLNGKCSADFSFEFVSGQISSLNTNPSGEPPFTRLWDFGFGFMDFNDQPNLDFSGNDTIRTCLKVIDALNCEVVRCKTLIVSPDYHITTSTFQLAKKEKYRLNAEHYREPTIKYTDEAGRVYRSDKFPQPDESYFRVRSVSAYDEPDQEFDTKRVEIEFSVRVFGNSENDYLDITESKAAIAVAYP